MTFDKKRTLLKAFVLSQINYCPLVGMCHNRCLNNIINHLHESALRAVYQDTRSDFKTLLENDKFVTIHVKNFSCAQDT